MLGDPSLPRRSAPCPPCTVRRQATPAQVLFFPLALPQVTRAGAHSDSLTRLVTLSSLPPVFSWAENRFLWERRRKALSCQPTGAWHMLLPDGGKQKPAELPSCREETRPPGPRLDPKGPPQGKAGTSLTLALLWAVSLHSLRVGC